MENISYRVYSNYRGWNELGIKSNIQKAISLIENKIYQEKAQYIIVEHYNDLDMDVPFKIIDSEEEFIKFKEEYKEKGKVKKYGNI